MTQMLLFDAPVSQTSFPVPPAESELVIAESMPAQESCHQVGSHQASNKQDSGLHHMGDLARLVLLRYELMAKRRARRAARLSAKSAANSPVSTVAAAANSLSAISLPAVST